MQDLIELIKKGKVEFQGPVWNLVSSEAKDLIGKLIVVDPDGRLSPFKALRHPWLVAKGESLSPTGLDDDPSSRELIQENLNKNKRRLTKTVASKGGALRMSFNKAVRLSTVTRAIDLDNMREFLDRDDDGVSSRKSSEEKN